jgi:hypothetical protein
VVRLAAEQVGGALGDSEELAPLASLASRHLLGQQGLEGGGEEDHL